MIANGIPPIDLLVVNLYPFEDALKRGADFHHMIENIDIGGPAMIRAAAKNHEDVAVIVDVADYRRARSPNSQLTTARPRLKFRRKLAQKAFARTAAYDAAISNWFSREIGETTPAWRAFGGKLVEHDALRREPAPVGGVLRRPRAPPRRRHARGSCRARSSLTTTSTTPTRPMSSSPNSTPREPQRSQSSNTPIPAAPRSARRSWKPTRRRSPAILSRLTAASWR